MKYAERAPSSIVDSLPAVLHGPGGEHPSRPGAGNGQGSRRRRRGLPPQPGPPLQVRAAPREGQAGPHQGDYSVHLPFKNHLIMTPVSGDRPQPRASGLSAAAPGASDEGAGVPAEPDDEGVVRRGARRVPRPHGQEGTQGEDRHREAAAGTSVNV